MAPYTIGDLHLSLGSDKPMDIFGDRWQNYVEKIQRGFSAVTENDTTVLCGDLNVAHREIDLKNPKTNRMNPGFTDEERGKMTELLDAGFTDTFRHLYPELEGAYTWWSFRAAARERNVGWRIDYFLCSDRLAGRIDKAYICPEIMGSDHCPVGLDLK